MFFTFIFIFIFIIILLLMSKRKSNEKVRNKKIIYSIFIILYIQITYWGLGPVFIADGPTNERIWAVATVILAYLILTGSFIIWRNKITK